MASVALRGVHKHFGSTRALRGATLEIAPAEVHALLGENGAGKSTLVRVLYGIVKPDAGTIEIDGRDVEVTGPRHALALGIGLVHQHFMGIDALTVAENLVLGDPGSAWLGAAALRRRAREVLDQFGLALDPDSVTADLAVAQKQRLEIVRALSRGARTLVFDEPTAVLAPSEVDELLELMDGLRRNGNSIVFISHKLDEISAVCDRVTVLRAGETVATLEVAGQTSAALGRLMVGEALPPPGRPIETPPGEVALALSAVSAEGLTKIDLEVRAGEVVALAGIDGNGQGALEELFAGVRPRVAGRVEIRRGPLALVSADRQRTGLVLDLSFEDNLVLEGAGRGDDADVFRRGRLHPDAQRRAALAAIERFDARATPTSLVRTLSGGNQQKLCIARALRQAPGVLVAVNPTRGLDVGATQAVRDEIRAQARSGVAVLLISTELDEVLELGNRVGVLFRGTLGPLLPVAEMNRERIGSQMLGVEP